MTRLAQLILYALFAAGIGYFSLAPPYRYADPNMASIKLSFSHAADRVEACAELTPRQINERAMAGEPLSQCGRERLPLVVELEVDGVVVFSDVARPSGLWHDGPASVYERLDIAAGPHTVTARLRDSARDTGWDYEHSEAVNLLPGRYFTIRFRAATGGFGFR